VLSWLRLLALDGKLAKAEPKTLRYRLLMYEHPIPCLSGADEVDTQTIGGDVHRTANVFGGYASSTPGSVT
jgi:hypothetical protein